MQDAVALNERREYRHHRDTAGEFQRNCESGQETYVVCSSAVEKCSSAVEKILQLGVSCWDEVRVAHNVKGAYSTVHQLSQECD